MSIDRRQLELDAYRITRELVTKMRGERRLPPAFLFSDDDLEDTISGVYTYHVLPMLDRYDPERGKLGTYLYTAIYRRAPNVAWRLVKGGIGTESPIELVSFNTTGSDSEYEDEPLDAETAEAGQYSSAAVLPYPTTPEGLETPGSDEWIEAMSRETRVAFMRHLLKYLPVATRRVLRKRVLYGNVIHGKLPRHAKVLALREALGPVLERAILEFNDIRDRNHTSKTLANCDSCDPPRVASDSATSMIANVGV